MIKELGIILLCLICFACGTIVINNSDSQAQSSNPIQDLTSVYNYMETDINGMKYAVFYVKNYSSQTGYDIEVINLTKDKLEVEYLQKQLEKLK